MAKLREQTAGLRLGKKRKSRACKRRNAGRDLQRNTRAYRAEKHLAGNLQIRCRRVRVPHIPRAEQPTLHCSGV